MVSNIPQRVLIALIVSALTTNQGYCADKDQVSLRTYTSENAEAQQIMSETGGSGGTQYGDLTVHKAPPVVTWREYDRAHPPGALRQFNRWEGWTEYEIEPQVDVHWNDPSQVVSQATVTLNCAITVWLPRGSTQKLKEHEDGHKQICLTIYEKSGLVTREIAQQYLMGRPWRGGQANTEFQAAYRREVANIIDWLNKTYDDITDHGNNNVESNAGVMEAFELCYRKFRPYLQEKAETVLK